MKYKHTNQSGFTLIEMMVAVSLFAIVMTIGVGALLSLIGANRKAQATQSVMNNLNIALDGMVRSIRMGTIYHCAGATEVTGLDEARDCGNSGGNPAGALLAFDPFGSESDLRVYRFYDGRLWRADDGDFSNELAITAPEVVIESFKIFVTGAEGTLNDDGETIQPKVVFSIQGTAGAEDADVGILGDAKKIRTTFNIQAVATQRVLDL